MMLADKNIQPYRIAYLKCGSQRASGAGAEAATTSEARRLV